MKTSLRALLVEDSEDDAMLVVRQLRDSGYAVTWERVETAATMRAALERRTWDIVICDYRLPDFDGLAALKLLQEAGLDLPFIIVSGTIGEDIAVGAMKAGAHDYLMKGQLARLAPAVERELREAASRRERRLVGEALTSSEARYRRLFESAKDGILILNAASGKVVDANPAMLAMLGHTREQMLGRRIWELTGFRNIVADQAGFDALQHAGTRHFEDRPLVTADGRRIEVEFVCTTYPMNRHRVMQCNLRDITGRKEAEAALRVGNAALEAAANAVVITDCEGRIEWANPAFTTLTGYTLAEAKGRNPRELIKSGRQNAEFYRHLWTTILAGRVWRGNIINRRKDGNLYTEDMTITPIRDEEGRLVHFVAIKQDVTERKQAEEALRREQDLLTSLIHTIPDRIYFKDRESRFVRMNDAQALQFGLRHPDEAIGRTDFDFFSREHARQAQADEQRIMTTGEPVIGREERETWPDGSVTWVSTTKVPLRDAEGRITGLVGISRDISDRKRLEAQFLQAQKMEAFGQLAGGVAHDFNNILGVMLMQLNLLQMESNLGGKVVSGLAELERHAMRGAGLTRQLLMFSRRQTMEPRILDLNLLLDDIARMLRRVLGEDITFELKKSAAPLMIEADAGMVEQVVMNLCINARDAMHHGGRLVVETRGDECLPSALGPAQKVACLAVSDTGCGMDPATKARIFEPFFTTKPAGKGTGLGLATVYGIVQQHRGWIEVDSAPNQGSTFRVYFPRQDRPTTAAEETAPREAPGGHESILLVEDEELLRSTMTDCLRLAGYRVVEAANGVEALQKWEEARHEFDLLITDFRMPEGLTGLQLATQLIRAKDSLKVIVMSGYIPDGPETGVPWLANITRIAKPFEVRLLLQTVRQILDAR